jgi:glycosyltransferase involved in cell wall biosynthesis
VHEFFEFFREALFQVEQVVSLLWAAFIRPQDADSVLEQSEAAKPLPRFLFVLPWDLHYVGGVNEVVKGLYREMSSGFHFEPLVLINSWEHKRAVSHPTDGRQVMYFRVRPLITRKHLLRSIVSAPYGLWKLSRLLRQQNVQIVNIHYPSLAALNFVLLKRLGLFRGRLLLSFHGVDIADARDARGVEAIVWRSLLRAADAVISCSASLRNDLLTFDATLAAKTVVIHNGISPALISRTRGESTRLPAAVDSFVLSIGTFEHKKGHDVLLRAFERIAANFPGTHLVIVGRAGDTLPRLQNLADASEWRDRAHLLVDVPHSEAMAILGRATVLCMPSRSEPFGIAIIEAGYLGVPVVATRVGGIVEIVTEDVDGVLVAADDVEGLASQLERLLESEALRARLGMALHERVLSAFTWSRALEQYLQLSRP